MPIPILQTKIHPPPISPDTLVRDRLTELLDAGRQRPLTLVSAPAGYGKSTLISRWLQSRSEPCAWLSLDDSDSDLRVFASYLVASVRTAVPEACSETLALLDGSAQLPVGELANCLVNELDAIDTGFNLALDDYHRIAEPSVHELLTLLLRHPPRPLHVLMATRRDPPLPLAGMLAKGHVTEVRLKDLEFNESETKALLEQVGGLPVAERTVATVQKQLEGWVAGLQLVLLNLRHQEDPDDFLSKLHGGTLRLQAYLLGEVLTRQSPALQNWLEMTSILDRFCAPLCEALCRPGQEAGASDLDGETFISALLDSNLFCIRLDERGEWCRYHHLFQQLLKDRLERTRDVREILALHSRASAWFERQSLIEEAIRHALAAEDVVQAAEVVEARRNDEFNSDRWYVVERWLSILPSEIKTGRPKLLLTEARIENYRHRLVRLPTILEQVESLAGDQTLDAEVSGEIAFFRGLLDYWNGSAESSQRFLETAVAQLSGTRNPVGVEAELYLGLARCMAGNKELGIRELRDGIARFDSSNSYHLSRLIASLIFVHLVCGDLQRARVETQRLQQVVKKFRMRNTEAWSSYLWAYTHLQAGELVAAAESFDQAVALRYVLEPRAAVDALAGLALTQQFLRLEEGAADTARRLKEFAQDLHESHYLSVASSCQARLCLLREDLQGAVEWARSTTEAPAPSELFMFLEAPSITQARVLIAAGSERSLREGTKLLQEIRDLSEACRFACQTIEVAVLQALALDRQGHADEALEVLEEAVVLAEPGGWIRPFVELGSPMADLLRGLLKRGVAVDHVRQILAAFRDGGRAVTLDLPREHRVSPSSSPHDLVEPLTNREEEILELLAERLSDKEIAGRLFVAPATVNTHLKHIYEKLYVSNRREAVARASDLGILPQR
jgi:LuxR family maltose regulon positive regulatory protein